MKRWLLVLLLWLTGARAEAHDLAVWVLSLRQVGEEDFVTRWERTPNAQDSETAYLLLRPLFPASCELRPPALHCPGGLRGDLGFAGLAALSNAALVNVRWLDGHASSYSFHAAEPRTRVEPGAGSEPPWWHVARSFFRLGVEHIALGWDHLLFVLGLLWLVPSRGALVKTVTSFTLAHSLTLSAATLGLTHVPVPPTEAVIALSIAFVSVEAVKLRRDGRRGLSSSAPWLIAFGFGLLHGFGFASALGEVALPARQVPIALVGFNAGVELGQLCFIALALGLAALARGSKSERVACVVPPLQYAAGTLAMYWFVERVAAFAVR